MSLGDLLDGDAGDDLGRSTEHTHKLTAEGVVERDGTLYEVWRCDCGAWDLREMDEENRLEPV